MILNRLFLDNFLMEKDKHWTLHHETNCHHVSIRIILMISITLMLSAFRLLFQTNIIFYEGNSSIGKFLLSMLSTMNVIEYFAPFSLFITIESNTIISFIHNTTNISIYENYKIYCNRVNNFSIFINRVLTIFSG